ncbi:MULTISPECIES: hypothetical protein [Bradyrhizobium]|nr:MULTISPECIES: hypothetical protein [Bradyrhizobium]
MANEMRKERGENGSQSAKTNREALVLKQREERRFRDALEDDEAREALKLLHAHNEEHLPKMPEEHGPQSANTYRSVSSQG